MARIAFALIASSIAAQQPVSPPPAVPATSTAKPVAEQGFRIAGVVVNSLTGQPVASASVAIARVANDSSREISKSFVTGADGRFSFAGLATGKYSLMARAHGFSIQAFDRHDEYASAIAVGAGVDSEHLVFRLQQDASIDGEVSDEDNDPVQYATVRVFSARPENGLSRGPITQAQTDDRGHYHIARLEPGGYYLAISAHPWFAQNVRAENPPWNATKDSQAAQDEAALDVAYPLTYYPDSADSPGSAPLQLTPGERQTVNVVLRAVPALHLRIHTEGPAQNAIPGRMIFPSVQQRVFDGYFDAVLNTPTSWSAPGVLEVGGLAPGHYVVEISPSTGADEKAISRAWYREIDLAGDMDISASEAPGFASVSGTMQFENSRVPKRALLQLQNPETGETQTAEVDQNGSFEFRSDSVRAGRYVVSLGAQDFYVKKLVAAGAKLSGRAIEIGPGANVKLSLVAARGQGQVDGVVMRNDELFSGAMVVLVPQDAANNTPLFRRDQSDSDGTFTLPRVVPGHYTVVALANGWDLEWSNPAVLQPYLKGGQPVQVPPDGKLQIKVQLQ